MNGLLRAILRAVLPRDDRALVMVEIEHLHRRRRERHGPLRAELWALGTVVGFVARLGRQRLFEGLERGVIDTRRSLRSIRRRPGWALATVTTLGLGAGGVVTVHAAADEVLLRPVPGIRAPDELVEFRLGHREATRPRFPVSQADLEAFRAIPALAQLEARVPLDVNLALGDAPPIRAAADAVTPGWFDALGVTPSAGRLPAAGLSVDEAEAGLEVVVSWSLASRVAEHPAGAVGHSLRVNGRDATVVGVTPPEFRGVDRPEHTDVWLPAGGLPVVEPSVAPDAFRSPRGVWTGMVGRLAAGATPEDVATAANRVMEERRDTGASQSFMSRDFEMQAFAGVGLDPGIRAEVRRTLALLCAATTLLLILAAANVAGLSLTRAVSRRERATVQQALGAGPGRLAAEVVTEHLVLGVAGGLVALAVALGAARILAEVRLDQAGATLAGLDLGPRAAAVALAVAVVTALAASVAPAALSARPASARPIRGASRSAHRLRRLFAQAQVAASVVLLVGAGLLARTVTHMARVDPGFDTEGILTFDLDASRLGLDDGEVAALVERLAAALDDAPSVAAAGIAFPQPVWGAYLTAHVRPAESPDAEGLVGAHLQVAGDLLGAMGVELLAGRDFSPGERRGDPDLPGVVIVSVDAARALFPDRDPLSVVGALLASSGDPEPLEIVGIVPALRRRGPRVDSPPSLIRPWGQSRFDDVASGWVRARPGGWADLPGTVRTVAGAVAPDLPLFDLRSVEAQVDRLVADTRVVTGLALATAILGLVLAALGLYGVLAWSVASRTREIGVRAALGSPAGALVRRFVIQGLGLAAAGLAPGIVGALLFARSLESRLFGVGTFDPVAWIAGLALLLAVAGLASWIPARRAAAVDVGRILASD